MPVSDPIADLLARIRNAQRSRKLSCVAPHSKMLQALVEVMKKENILTDAEVVGEGVHRELLITFPKGRGHMTLTRVSKPGRRVYRRSGDLRPVLRGLGVAIVSTSKGVMTDARARKEGVGGEVLCTIIPAPF